MIAVLLLIAVSQETVQTVPGARDQLDTKLLATLRHERKRGALLRNKKSALLISDPTCSFYYTETVHQLRAQVERAHEKDGRAGLPHHELRRERGQIHRRSQSCPVHWHRSISACCCWTPTCASLRSR